MGDTDYILFYSNKCLHCKELFNLFAKDPQINQKFTKVCVDSPGIKIPPYVKSVPSAIIPNNGSPSLLVGSAIFKWYNTLHAKTVETQGIQDWDPHTMSGYSDGFSYISSQDVIKKSFAFLGDNHSITTPDEKNYSGGGGNNGSASQQVKTQLDNDYERYMSQRKNEVPSAVPRL